MFSRIFARKIFTFPDNWFVMLMFQFSVALKVTIVMASFMQERLGIINQEEALWCSFFKLVLEFVNSKILYIESFTDTKKKMVMDSYGDMRTDVCQILSVMWQALDAWQYQFRDQLLPDFLRLSTVPQPLLGATGVDLYVSLIQREIENTNGVAKAAEMTITQLEELYNDISANVKGNGLGPDEEREAIMNFFANIFGEKLSALGPQASGILTDVASFLDMTYEIRSVPEEPSFEDDRTAAILRLCEWAKKTNRLELFKKNVNDLIRAHTASGNFAEAGNLCLYLTSLYQWSSQVPEEEFAEYPRQPQHERKVALYKQAIVLLDKAKMWERCLSLCQELKSEGHAYSELESQMDPTIKTTDRFFSEYFRVGYFGRGFPAAIRNKEFIYRGLELERLSDFSQRISAKFPGAKMLTYTDPPTEEVLNSDTQNLQIFSVKSSSLEEKEGKPNPRIRDSMHPNTQKYYAANEVSVFLYSKPFRKNKQKGEQQHEEFADLWYRNYYYVLSDALPSLNRRADITRIDITETHPVDNAVNAIKDKNREIGEMTTRYEGGNAGNLAPFTMILKGVIDAAVSGGTVLYTKAFFNDDWLGKNRDRVHAAEALNQALVSQVVALDKGLRLHAQLCPQEMAALQQDLDARLIKVKQDLKASLGPLGELFRRYGGSGNFSLGGLDLTNLDVAPPSSNPGGPPSGGLTGSGGPGSPMPGMKMPGMPPGLVGSPGPLPKFPHIPPGAALPTSPVPTSAGAGGYGGLPGMAALPGSPLQRRVSTSTMTMNAPTGSSPPTGSPGFPQIQMLSSPGSGNGPSPLGVQTAPAGGNHVRAGSFGNAPPTMNPKFPGPPGGSIPGGFGPGPGGSIANQPKFPGPLGGPPNSNYAAVPPPSGNQQHDSQSGGPPNSNYGSLPPPGSNQPKFPGPPGPGGPPSSNYSALPTQGNQPKFPGPGGNMGHMTAPPKLGAGAFPGPPNGGPTTGDNGPPNSNYGSLPPPGGNQPKYPGPPGPNMGHMTAPTTPKLPTGPPNSNYGSVPLPNNNPGGMGISPGPAIPKIPQLMPGGPGGPPNSNYGSVPPPSMNQPKYPVPPGGNMGNMTAPPKLGSTGSGGTFPPSSTPGGPPNSNYGSLPPPNSQPKFPGPPGGMGNMTAPPNMGSGSGGMMPPAPNGNPSGPGGPPPSNYGSLPPPSNQPKFPGPPGNIPTMPNIGNMTAPARPGFPGSPGGGPVSNPPAPNGPPQSNYGVLPTGPSIPKLPAGTSGSFGTITAPPGGGGAPRLGSTAGPQFGTMTAPPGGMQPKFPGPHMPMAGGGPPNSNYGSVPPPAGGGYKKMPPPPTF